jgi:hypothetical protein
MKIQTKEQEPNPFARVGRLAKVTRMVRELDYQLRIRGGDPYHDPARVLQMLEGFTPGHWVKLAIVAGAKPPSKISIRLILDEYRERVAALRAVIETTGEELERAS